MLTRTLKTRFELKERRRLTWYAALFNVPATIMEMDDTGKLVRYQEVIRPTAFDSSLKNGDIEVIANVDHNEEYTFAERSTGRLLLQADEYGLFCSCYVPRTEQGDTILERVRKGELDGSSFQFMPVEDVIGDDGTVERIAVKLYDVTLTSNPAYAETKGEVMLRTQNKLPFLMMRYKYAKLKNWSINTQGKS